MNNDLWLELYKLERDQIQRKLSHILAIRGWAISVGVGVLVAMFAYRSVWVSIAGILLLAFAYQERIYQSYLKEFEKNAKRFAERLSVHMEPKEPLLPTVSYRWLGPFWVAYGLLFGLIVASVVVLAFAADLWL